MNNDKQDPNDEELDSPNDIICFRRQPRYTHIDYRAKLSLKADEVRQFRTLCDLIEDDEDEYEIILTTLCIVLLNMDSFHLTNFVCLDSLTQCRISCAVQVVDQWMKKMTKEMVLLNHKELFIQGMEKDGACNLKY